MKPNRRDGRKPQLNYSASSEAVEPDDSSHSGIRPTVSPSALQPEPALRDAASSGSETAPALGGGALSTPVTVVFRGVLPMERLVQMIRRRAAESAPSTPLCVEVEQHADAQRWCVRVHSPQGELSALEAGPFLAVTRAFALLHQAS
jgi:hypothetical protein